MSVGEQCDLNDFEHSIQLSEGCCVLFHKLLVCGDFPTTISDVQRGLCEKQKMGNSNIYLQSAEASPEEP